ncbi:hypothetical protein EV356DRAFT_457830, partial [Viridothelium virens]
IVFTLIRFGAGLNLYINIYSTALYAAYYQGYKLIIRTFFKYNADINTLN